MVKLGLFSTRKSMDVPKPTILILCTGNSCRSQIAEGLFRHYAGERYDIHSAGLRPAHQVHPVAVEVMAEKGIDIRNQRPKDVGIYLGRLSVRTLFVVCHQAEKQCPRIFPGMLSRVVWPLDDPAAFVGSPEATVEMFRSTRDELERRIQAWLSEHP